jgi:hypothetical protein
MPSKTFRCRLHLHHWETLKSPDGDPYECCARCKVDREILDSKATFVGMDYAAFNEVAKKLSRQDDPESRRSD